MTTSLIQAADSVKALTNTFKALGVLGAFLDETVALEQLKAEAEVSAKAAQAVEAKAKEDREAAIAELAKVKQAMTGQEAKAQSIVEGALAKAKEIEEEAQRNAEGIVFRARSELVTMKGTIAELHGAVSAKEVERDNLQQELEALEDKIAKLKTKLQKQLSEIL